VGRHDPQQFREPTGGVAHVAGEGEEQYGDRFDHILTGRNVGQRGDQRQTGDAGQQHQTVVEDTPQFPPS
jgi:hypothetical protein